MVVADLGFVGNVSSWLAKISKLSELRDESKLCVQIRARETFNRSRRELAGLARDRFRSACVPLIWNGDEAFASEFGYDGLHYAENVLAIEHHPAVQVSRSASVHSVAALRQAEAMAMHFVVFGAVFEPTWKDVKPRGLIDLRALVSRSRLPVLAIGGMQIDRLPAVFETGAHGIACLSEFMLAENPVPLVEQFLDRWLALGGEERVKATLGSNA